MKKPFAASVSILVVLVLYTSSTAQEAPENSPNRFGLNARLGFNISAKFKNLGGLNPMNNIGPAAGGGANRFYDDGFVRVDGSGDKEGLTWFWGYENPAQIQGDSLVMHSSSSPANGVVKSDGDPQLGFELTYARRIGGCWHGTWGVESALGYTDVSIHDHQTLFGTATISVSDAYPLGGITPPLAPYSGSFAGPGPLVGDSPARTTVTAPGSALVLGDRKLDAQLYTFRLGPYWEIPLSRRFSAQLGGGLSLGVVDSEFSFTEAVKVGGVAAANRAGRDSKSAVLVGGYVEAGVNVAITDRWGVFTAVQYQYLSGFSQSAAGKEAELDFSKAVYYVFGVRLSF